MKTAFLELREIVVNIFKAFIVFTVESFINFIWIFLENSNLKKKYYTFLVHINPN